jgi:hypothetical protein
MEASACRKKVEARPAAGQTGRTWSVGIPEIGEMIRLRIDGVPPYLADRPEQVFPAAR